jgi:hypothetical protein
VVSVLYPKQDTEVEMGQPLKFITRVTNFGGSAITDAKGIIGVRDPGGGLVATIAAVSDSEGTYRSDSWTIPHRTLEGRWSFTFQAETEQARGSASSSFGVKDSTSEVLLNKYGFWLDAPTLRNIVPQLYGERGDAQNGMILWGGFIPSPHVLPANWVQVQWREGDFPLENAEAVRRFMLEQLGDLGYTPVREIGPINPTRFKQWDAWRVAARGEFSYEDLEFVVFYAPEVNRTYSIGTTVVLPPAHVDAHALLRDSFAVLPEIHALGMAPEPLPKLRPGPQPISPPLGTRFQGLSQPIVLRWTPVKETAQDEYYELVVDYNDREGNPTVKYTTRETQFTLPETLYRVPNCGVFNWQVTLMRQTGVDKNGQPQGEPITYSSLYWYVMWTYPPGEKQPFTTACPNDQF